MAGRLTKKITKTIQDEYSLGNYLYYDFDEIDDTDKLLNKLGKLEDILEKYGLDIQNLDYILEDYSKNQGRDFAICEERDTLRQERDTWQKACELACKHIAEVEWLSCPETDDISESENEIKTLTKQSLNYFYQQAKNKDLEEC